MSKYGNFFVNCGVFSVKAIGDKLSVSAIIGDSSIMISGISTLKDASSSDMSFLANPKYKNQFEQTKAGACIVDKSFLHPAKAQDILNRPSPLTLLVSSYPYADYAYTLDFFYRDRYSIGNKVSIDPSANIGENCVIGPGVVIGEQVTIADNCSIMANSYIGPGVKVGKGTIIHANTSLTYCYIGENCIIHSGVKIGQDGFGFAPSPRGIIKVKQIGCVIIGNDVEIGANTCIDRGALSDTVIGDSCKLDNLIQIGHNVVLGRGCVIAGQTGIAGSTKIGDYAMIGGQVGIAGHLTIGNKISIAAQSGVIKDIADGMTVGGTPAIPLKDWHRQNIFLQKLSLNHKALKTQYDLEGE